MNVLTNAWSTLTCRHDARYLWLQLTHSSPPESALEAASHKLFLNGLSVGTFVSAAAYHGHWKTTFCETRETWTGATRDHTDSDSDDDEEDTTGNRLSALFQHDTESLSISWKRSENLHHRMEIALDSLADRILVVSREEKMVHLFLFFADHPKLYRGKPRPPAKFHTLLDSVIATETVWERVSCFESCDHQTFGSCNVLHLKMAAQSQNLNALILRLKLMDFAVYHSNVSIMDVEKSGGGDLPWPSFQTFDAAYAWYSLMSRGFKVSDQARARSGEFIQLLDKSTNNPQLGRILDAVAARVDERPICDLNRTFDEELENLQRDGRTSGDVLLKPVGDQFIFVRRLLITPTTVRGLSAQWCVGNRVVRHFGSDRFIRAIIRDEDLSLLSAANRVREPIRVITELLKRDLVIGDRRYHFLGCSNSQLREHGLWLYASDGQQGHTVDEIRRWMGDLSQERCVATYMSRLGQFFSASRNTVEVNHIDMIPDVMNNNYCFTDGIGTISPLLAEKVMANLYVNTSRRVSFYESA